MIKRLAMLVLTIALPLVANAITTHEYSQVFKNYNACFILYNLSAHKIVAEYNPNHRCDERISPDSTFKIVLSLMAFNQGIIQQNTVFKWDGKKRELPDWNQNLTPNTWIKYSALWVSQRISPQLGYARIKHYLAGFSYGNQDFSGDPGQHNGLTRAWVDSSLKISAQEQLHFLDEMTSNHLPVSPQSVEYTKKNMYLGKLKNGADYFGKTGSGRNKSSKLRDGWFVGFVENGKQKYIFVSNLTDKVAPSPTDHLYGSYVLKPLTLKLLNEYFSK